MERQCTVCLADICIEVLLKPCLPKMLAASALHTKNVAAKASANFCRTCCKRERDCVRVRGDKGLLLVWLSGHDSKRLKTILR